MIQTKVSRTSLPFKVIFFGVGLTLGLAVYFGPDVSTLMYFTLFFSFLVYLSLYKPSAGLAIMFFVLPFHTFIMSFLYSNVDVSREIVKILQVWKEALVLVLIARVAWTTADRIDLIPHSPIERAIILYILVNCAYFVLPLGPDSLTVKLMGLRHNTFFLYCTLSGNI